MATAASSTALPNIPYRWRRKVYMNIDHTTTRVEPLDGASTSKASDSSTTGPFTGPSTGPFTSNTPRYKDGVTQTDTVETPQDGNGVITTCQEPEPRLTPASAPTSVEYMYTIKYDQLVCKLKYMQRIIEERKRAADREQELGKENMAPPRRPLKRKRAAPCSTPPEPVRQSKRLQQKGQGRSKE